MPEGGEVRRIVDQMAFYLKDKKINNIEIISGRYKKQQPVGLSEIFNSLPIKILDLNCKGKFIYFNLQNNWSIWNTLGLTGGWTKSPDKEFNRVKFSFDDCEPVYFYDTRNFGTLKFEKNEENLLKKLNSLGPDILQEDVPDFKFKARLLRKSKKTLPEVLMDQEILSGIGNYIKAEALYMAKLSPHRIVASLSDAEFGALNFAVKKVIRDSYFLGGSTFKNYSDFYDDAGEYSDRFLVYGKKQDSFGNPIIKEETLDKRTTWWVPKIQK